MSAEVLAEARRDPSRTSTTVAVDYAAALIV
jgi:hypothetical protein